MSPNAQRLSKQQAGFSQRVAGFVPFAWGLRLELCPLVTHTLPFPPLSWHFMAEVAREGAEVRIVWGRSQAPQTQCRDVSQGSLGGRPWGASTGAGALFSVPRVLTALRVWWEKSSNPTPPFMLSGVAFTLRAEND